MLVISLFPKGTNNYAVLLPKYLIWKLYKHICNVISLKCNKTDVAEYDHLLFA